jgi:hypothetical protein
MTTTLVPLSAAAEINRLHHAAQRSAGEALQLARQSGDLLLTVKAQLDHGAFLPWLEANCDFGTRQAQKYMRLAMNWARLDASRSTSELGSISINAALEQLVQQPNQIRPGGSHLDDASLADAWKAASPRVRALFAEDVLLPFARDLYSKGECTDEQLREWERLGSRSKEALRPLTVADVRIGRRRYGDGAP